MPNDGRLILALNCGSSSLKYGAYRVIGEDVKLVGEGEAEEIRDYGAAFEQAWDFFAEKGIKDFWCVGHRVVHGGPDLRDHQLLTDQVLDKLRAAIPFAPLHLSLIHI